MANKTNRRASARDRVRKRIRKKVHGTAERPRLAVFKSNKFIYVQAIDDETGKTLASASSRTDGNRSESGHGLNLSAAELVGKSIAESAKEQGIKEAVFDRGGYRYHGRVKKLAEAARAAGLKI